MMACNDLNHAGQPSSCAGVNLLLFNRSVHLPINQKKDLVSYGLNGSRFKNISTPELGEIFTQELGL